MDKELTYNQALTELEGILKSFDSGEADIDTLSAQVARATELITFCRERLQKVEKELEVQQN
ncbi:MAG: exodeoxyribonuclease VII small subunit [Tidjanibacter sp.]|nr:exodeoxyribonuclease VII small subunit [Tidjanibacter sp.]MBR3682131.1 exodeoxyribonuclease VII small subunit [Tidjanibacter sp.]MBR3853048.1 exodeoxyribonuclease VII small subunit [Tidjanibacter sp.]MBR7129829.1 exodeoxyribonuclease VII small subunit [Tidjanibacter sp.]